MISSFCELWKWELYINKQPEIFLYNMKCNCTYNMQVQLQNESTARGKHFYLQWSDITVKKSHESSQLNFPKLSWLRTDVCILGLRKSGITGWRMLTATTTMNEPIKINTAIIYFSVKCDLQIKINYVVWYKWFYSYNIWSFYQNSEV